MITVYYGGSEVEKPTPVECVEPGYPNKDVDGRTMYINSHFTSEAEAWDCLMVNAKARQELISSRVVECQRVLARAKENLVEGALYRTQVESNLEEWQRDTPTGGKD